MADLAAVTEADVRAVYVVEQFTLPAGADIVAGQVVGIDANGKAVLADADTGPVMSKGIALTSAKANMPVTILAKGLVDLGDIFTGAAVNASIFSSGTAGRLADAVVGALPAIGTVHPAWGYTTVDKLMRVEL